MILYLDIETYRGHDTLDEETPKMRELFTEKYVPNDNEDPNNFYKSQAALYPEFGRIICISVGYESATGEFHKYSLTDLHDEVKILNGFNEVMSKFKDIYLGGYNVKYFDVPFILKRYLINGIKVPKFLRDLCFYPNSLTPLKPWESKIVDIMDIYKCGNTRATSLGVACNALDINCKTSEVTGVNMFLVPLDELDTDLLTKYCEEDVYSTYLLHRKLINLI